MIPQELTNDLKLLGEQGSTYQVVEDGGRIYIIFKDHPLPPGIYNMEKTDVMIFTTPQYPNAGFDMFWVDQNLLLKSTNRPPKSAENLENYLQRSWRRFSYHPYNNKPWNPSEDNVLSFFAYVEQRLGKGD